MTTTQTMTTTTMNTTLDILSFLPETSEYSTTQQPNLLMQLPPEIRLDIFQLMFEGVSVSRAQAPQKVSNQMPILLSSRQLRQEAMPVFFNEAHFRLSGDESKLPSHNLDGIRRASISLENWEVNNKRTEILQTLCPEKLQSIKELKMSTHHSPIFSLNLLDSSPSWKFRFYEHLVDTARAIFQSNPSCTVKWSVRGDVAQPPADLYEDIRTTLILSSDKHLHVANSALLLQVFANDPPMRERWDNALPSFVELFGFDIADMTVTYDSGK